MTITPSDNSKAIAQMGQEMRQTIGVLIDQFIRPNAQQVVANAEAIGRVEQLCESNARAIAAESNQITELRQNIKTLGAVTDDVAAEGLIQDERISANEKRFETLLAESRSDRESFKQEMQKMSVESTRRFDAQIAGIAAARDESTRRFDAQIAEMKAQGEQIRALLSALASTNSRLDAIDKAS